MAAGGGPVKMDSALGFLYLSIMAMTLGDIAAEGRFRLSPPTGIIRCEPVWKLTSYRLKDHLLWCVLDGGGTASFHGKSVALGPGTCPALPPGPCHDAVHDPQRRLRVFYLHAGFLDRDGRPLVPEAIDL